ncbi:L-dopachrome tautomerase-related protein [Gallaecimonas pentaromativorans]|uniref:L-dopachrome tautomerase-related protein n=1 Tax=Gallaecimonas pentaromativorans TaxID=584787 RepID=UPI003A921CF8
MKPRYLPLSLLAAALMVPLTIDAAELPHDQAFGQIEPIFTFHGPMPTGVTQTQGRLFVNFPRWGDDVPFTVAELKNGKAVPYPNAAINVADTKAPARHFLSVQSVVADGQGKVWVLDTAAPGFSKPVKGGAKLVAVDLASNKVVKTIVFPDNVMLPSTYVNDMRFDFRVGKAGVAYVTDSSLTGPGAIIVLDLATGKALRRLSGDKSTSPDPEFVPVVEGKTMMVRNADGATESFTVASDGIALSPDGKTLYFCPLSSRHLYAIDTALLRDPSVSEDNLAKAVRDLGEKGASDGLESDNKGQVYAGDYEHNSVRVRLPGGQWQTLAHDPRILWPDTFSVGDDGYLYFTANQLHRQPGFNGGQDKRQKPYSLFRIAIDSKPAPTK